jgi:hypothetical protein
VSVWVGIDTVGQWVGWTHPEFSQAGTRLDWSWSKSFLKFKNILGDAYQTTWLEVLGTVPRTSRKQ